MQKFLLFLLFSYLSSLCFVMAQERMLSGKITDAKTGEGIPGINIFVKGTVTGTVSDINGDYKLAVTTGMTIVFQSLGMKKQEFVLGAENTIDVKMEDEDTTLDELVITGYREEDKRTFTGSATSVTSKSISLVPVASIDQILQGQSPGLLVAANSGQPGAAAQVRIRGTGSINGRNQPLYILDGIEITAQQFGTLNPNDFERIDVLRDASSAAIYGSRGTNGVIVITSKKGKAQKTQFNYTVQYGVSAAPDWKVGLLNTAQKIDLELETGIGIAPSLTEAELDELRAVETDWSKEILSQSARTVNHEISATGGNENTTFYVSGSIFKQDGVVRNTKLDRYTARFNINHIAGNFRFGTNFSLGYSKSNYTRENDTGLVSPLNAIRWSNPYESVFIDGEYNRLLSNGYRLRSLQPNGVAELELNIRNFEDVKIVGTVYLEYDIPSVKGLTLRTNWGVDYFQREETVLIDPRTASGKGQRGLQGSFFRNNAREPRFTGTTSINYNTKFGEDHNLNVGVFQEVVFREFRNFNFTGYGLTGRLKNEAGITLNNQNFIPNLGGTASQNALVSFFTDVNYSYKNKYSLRGTARVDGSSRFGANNRYAYFYSLGASWVLSEEAFMESTKGFVNTLKIRASYGILGNQEGIGDFPSLELYGGTANYAGIGGVNPLSLPNPDLKWESSSQSNVGIDYALWDNRISGSLDFYNKLTKDLYLLVELSRSTGFGTQLQNIGEVRNRGIEFLLNVEVLRAKDFSFKVGGNFAYNKNEVLKLDGDRNELISGIGITKIGAPLNSFYLVDYAGVNPANGDALYYDLDGNVTPNFELSYSRIQGTFDAPWTGGLTTSITYKSLEVSALFTFMAGHYKYNNERVNIDNPDYITDNVSADLLRAWRNPGDITDVPRIDNIVTGVPRSPYFSETTRYLEKSDFLRLRNVNISYTLPSAWSKTIRFRVIRLFAQGQNLLTFTSWRGNDPEVTTTNGAVYPTQRTFTFGINAGF